MNQVNSRDDARDWEIVGEVETNRSLLDTHSTWSFVWTPREGNYAAHSLASWCINLDLSGRISLDLLPDSITDCDAGSVSA